MKFFSFAGASVVSINDKPLRMCVTGSASTIRVFGNIYSISCVKNIEELFETKIVFFVKHHKRHRVLTITSVTPLAVYISDVPVHLMDCMGGWLNE